MRALDRRLRPPRASEDAADESAYAMYLPRRGTRRLYAVLAVVAGIGLGWSYAQIYLRDQGVLWLIATAVIGAVLGFVLFLMPGVMVQYLRKLAYRFTLSRRAARLRTLLGRAHRRLTERVENDPDSDEPWEALGVVELLRGDHQRAAEWLQRAAAAKPDDPLTQANLAVALAELGELDRAARLLTEAAVLPESVEVANHNLGVLLARNPPVAVVDHVLASIEELRSAGTLNSLGIWELRRNDLELAEDYFRQAAEANPVDVAPRANLAVVAHRRGRTEDAMARMTDAEILDPLNPAIHNDLGVLLCAASQPMAAARQLSRASFLSPGSVAVELNRGCVRLLLGQYPDALDSFNNPLVRDEHPVQAAHDTALALIGQARYTAALENLEPALGLAPGDPDLHTNAGCLAWALGDEQRMADELEQAATAGSDEIGVTTNLATARIMRGRAREAVAMLEKLSERHRTNMVVTFHLGLAYLADALTDYRIDMSRPERQEFFRALHRAVRPLDAAAADKETCSYEALANLALYRYLRQQYEQAIEAWGAVAKAYPEDGYLQSALGTCMAEQAMALQSSHEADGDSMIGRAREMLVRARRHLNKAIELQEQTPDVYCNLGMAVYNLGDVEGARQAFRKMLQIESSDDAANNLAIVYAKEASRLRHEARSAALVSEERQRDLNEQMRTAISTALHYFHKALEVDRDNAILHGNIGLAYMIRNRETDVESALRHWQHMRRLGGAEQAKRYEELTALVDAKEGTRAEFDETLMNFRPLDPHKALTNLPPSVAGPHYAMLPVTQEADWVLISSDREVRRALRLRERITGLKQRLARLSM